MTTGTARRGLWFCLLLQMAGDLAMIYLARAMANPTGHPWPLPHWGNAIVMPLSLFGLLFAIAGPPVVLRIISRSPDSGWMKLALSLVTLALSAIWPTAAIAVVG